MNGFSADPALLRAVAHRLRQGTDRIGEPRPERALALIVDALPRLGAHITGADVDDVGTRLVLRIVSLSARLDWAADGYESADRRAATR